MVLFVCWLYIEYSKEFYTGERIKHQMNSHKKNLKKKCNNFNYKRINTYFLEPYISALLFS